MRQVELTAISIALSVLVAAGTGNEAAAAATSPSAQAQVILLHPLEGPFSASDRPDDDKQQASLDLPPAGIDGLRALRLGWAREGTLRLIVLVSTRAADYEREIISQGALPNPTWAAFETLPIGDMLVIAFGWGVTAQVTDGPLACEHYALACRVGTGGAPSCSPPVLVARAPQCQTDGYGAGLPIAVPRIQRRNDYVGRPVRVEGVTFIPEDLTFKALDAAAANRKMTSFKAEELGTYTGIGAARLFSRARQTDLHIGLTTSRGEFVGGLHRWHGRGSIGWLSHKERSGTALIGWNVGVGVIDPPESTFSVCQADFVVCRMDARDVPWCSDAITLARAAACVEGKGTGLPDELPDPTWDSDGGAFRIQGRRFRVETPGWKR